MIVHTPLGQLRLVLGGVQHLISNELAEMENHLALSVALLVVPVHHVHLVLGGVDRILGVPLVVDLLGGDIPLVDLGIHPLDVLRTAAMHVEHVGGVLHVLHLHVPVQVQKLHLLHGQVAPTARLVLVPANGIHAPALDALAPHHPVVDLLQPDPLMQSRQDQLDLVGLQLVRGRPCQHVGSRIVVHSIGVKILHRVEHVSGDRLHLLAHDTLGRDGISLKLGASDLLAGSQIHHVAAAVPLLVELDLLVDPRLGGLELVQPLPRSRDLVLTDAPSPGRSGFRHFCLVRHLRSPLLTSRYRFSGFIRQLSSRSVSWVGRGFSMQKYRVSSQM